MSISPGGVSRARRRWAIAGMLLPAGVVVGAFFVGGVAQAVAQSFGYQPFLPGARLSTDAYVAVWRDPAIRASFALTLRVTVLSTVIAAVAGTAAALALRRLERGRRLSAALFRVNLAVPHLVGALTMTLLLAQSGTLSRLAHAAGLTAVPSDFPALVGDRAGWGIVAEYAWKETPFVGVIALAALSRGVEDLERVAGTLGASPVQRLRHVTLPLLAPSVAAASTLVLAFAAGSYEVPYLLGRPFPATLPVIALQYSRDVDLTRRPQAMVVGVLVTVLSVLLVGAYLALVGRLSRRPV